MRITLSNVKDTKTSDGFLFENQMETHYKYYDEKTPRQIESGKPKYLQQTLNSMNNFLLLSVMSCLGSHFKLLRMSWYINMKPLRTNLKLFINKYFCVTHV